MSICIPIRLARKKAGRMHVGVFRFHAQVQDVPVHAFQKYDGQIVLLDDLPRFFGDERSSNRSYSQDRVVPLLKAFSGFLKKPFREPICGFESELLPFRRTTALDRFRPRGDDFCCACVENANGAKPFLAL